MITKLTQADIGAWIFYKKGLRGEERGKIKSFDNEKKVAWVVYKANMNWDADHWTHYTAAPTYYRDLTF